MLDPNKLYKCNKSSDELIQLLSPQVSEKNRELFYLTSNNQERFNKVLITKGLEAVEGQYPLLDSQLRTIQFELNDLMITANKKDNKRQEYDLEIAKIVHSNLPLFRKSTIDYDFWRYITLFHLIEVTKWRWEKDPIKSSNWVSNAKSIFGRALGLSFDISKFNEEGTIHITLRNQRINAYRYWWLGDKLYDNDRKYYYLDKLSELYQSGDVSMQDFINHLEGNKLTSKNDRISKLFVNSLYMSGKKFSETEARQSFMRYNAYKNRKLMDVDEKTFGVEICKI